MSATKTDWAYKQALKIETIFNCVESPHEAQEAVREVAEILRRAEKRGRALGMRGKKPTPDGSGHVIDGLRYSSYQGLTDPLIKQHEAWDKL